MVIDSKNWRFYGLVTDLQLGATDPRFADEQSEGRLSPELADLLHRANSLHQPGSHAAADDGQGSRSRNSPD